jgi:phenylalanyl-tRNA synthetase beta subunit
LKREGENMECKGSIRYTRRALSDSGSVGKVGKIHPQVEGNLGLPVMIFFLCWDRVGSDYGNLAYEL